MPAAPRMLPVECPLSPREVLRRWPRSQPLTVLCSAPHLGDSPRWARWSYLAAPEAPITLGGEAPNVLQTFGRLVESTRLPAAADLPVPFAGGWMVALGYELGRTIEPAAAVHSRRVEPSWPWSIVLWRCPALLAFDHHARQWWSVGGGGVSLEDLLAQNDHEGDFTLAEPAPLRPCGEYLDAVRRAVEYIHAGDCFQANLSHRIGASFSGSTRALFGRLLDAAAPWYGAYLEVPQGRTLHAAMSVSPELFVELDGRTRDVVTRPIKGTRPGRAPADELRASVKDQAELAMIIDLMRNDLGRVCEIGSVRVQEARTIERHGAGTVDARAGEGVHHGVATIRGRVRPDQSIIDLLRAIFPGGSITGAPKVRAMQIIEELEPGPRGLYTGAIGYISDGGSVALNIAIRTAVVHGTLADDRTAVDQVSNGRLVYGAGAGIVADSIPEQEWQETLDKAGVLRRLCPHPAAPTVHARAAASAQEVST